MSCPAKTPFATVNGKREGIACDRAKSLLDFLREDLGLTGTHGGCHNGDCGACTVLIDSEPYKSCLVPCMRAAGRSVDTLEGLAEGAVLHAVQRHFWTSNAFQCGYCLSGNILCTTALLNSKPEASEAEIDDALAGNLCRCTGYQQVVVAARAVFAEARARGDGAKSDGTLLGEATTGLPSISEVVSPNQTGAVE